MFHISILPQNVYLNSHNLNLTTPLKTTLLSITEIPVGDMLNPPSNDDWRYHLCLQEGELC